MDRARRFAVRGAVFTAAVFAVFAVPVAAQKPSPKPSLKATPAPMPTPKLLPSSVITTGNVPATLVTPTNPPFVWWKDFPWTVLASVGVIGAALIARNTSERKRVSDEAIASERLKNERDLAEARQKQERELAEKRHEQERDLAQKRQEQEREHFRSKELQDQFGDIQNRLASTEPIIRANAALRLAQFGETLKPGAEQNAPRTKENNPYFIPVISQLSTALYLEPNPVIRKSIRESLKNLIAFACIGSGDQPLLHALIERLADANRTAKEIFVTAYAEWTTTNTTWQEIDKLDDIEGMYAIKGQYLDERNTLEDTIYPFLCAVAPFCSSPSTTRSVVKFLTKEGEVTNDNGEIEIQSLFHVHREKFKEKRAAQSDVTERAKKDATLFSAMETAAQQLIETRDALTSALHALTTPTNFRSFIRRSSDEEANAKAFPFEIKKYKRPYPVVLDNCFLCGAKFGTRQLQGVSMKHAYLQDTKFFRQTSPIRILATVIC